MSRFQDWDDIAVGLWIFLSPWLIGYDTTVPPAAWAAWALGATVCVLGCIAVVLPRLWEEPLNVVLGIGLIASPWVLGFSHHIVLLAQFSVAGILVIGLAIWALGTDERVHRWVRGRREAIRQAVDAG
jgi:hypothetical protein